MKSFKLWGAMLLTALLIGIGLWWATTEVKDRNDPLNQYDAFVYSDNAILYWFELKSRKGKVDGNFHQQKLIEGYREMSSIVENIFPLTGELTEKGYKFYLHKDGKTSTLIAKFSGPHLAVQKQGEIDQVLYNPVKHKELDGYVQALLHYHDEEKENNRLRKFFSDLRQVYGYLHTSENGTYQFIKIEEALLEGELTGFLHIRAATGDINHPYQETKYVLNGITDGLLLEFYTTVDGKKVKLTGKFHEDANSFDLSFWNTDENLTFYAITEEELKQSRE